MKRQPRGAEYSFMVHGSSPDFTAGLRSPAEETMPLISLIVPVHNAENHLERCLNSIAAQSFTDFECRHC